MDTPEPTAGHPLGHPPGQPSKMDTLAWPAGRHERTPRRTATATDRMPDAFLWSSAVVHPCGLAEEYEMTNDSVPHTVGCGGDRPLGCPPLCGPAGCSSGCPAVQDGSVHPDRQCGWAVGDQAERPCSANPSPQARGACLPENRASNTSPPRSGPRRSVTVWRPATWPPQGLGDAAVHRQVLQVQAVQAIVGGQRQAVELGRPRPRRSTHPGGGAGSWPSSCGRRCGGRGGQGPRSG
jgi:hypothetical protein